MFLVLKIIIRFVFIGISFFSRVVIIFIFFIVVCVRFGEKRKF